MTQTIFPACTALMPDERTGAARIFAEWLHRQGHQIVKTQSSYWVQSGPHVFQAFPYHWVICPNARELRSLFMKYGAIALRYSAPVTSLMGKISYHVIYASTEYSLDILPKKARYDVRRGLKNAVIEPVSFERLANEGWKARYETLIRQGRTDAENRTWWESLCRNAIGLAGFETWAAIVEGEIVASLVAFSDNNCCSILYQQSKTAHLGNGVNNALTFIFTQEILKRKGISSVFYGLHSLDAPASVDEYKFRMRFIAKPVRQQVVFHPFIRPLLNGISHTALSRLVQKYPNKTFLTKAEGMVRFYLEGKLALSEQKWPSCLLEHRE